MLREKYYGSKKGAECVAAYRSPQYERQHYYRHIIGGDFIKGFALKDGDVLIENNEIQMVDGEELLRQTAQSIIETNKGEWFTDWDEGIDFSNILGKGVTEEMIIAEIEDGLRQVDETLNITDFDMSIDGRMLTVSFSCMSEDSDTEIEVEAEWD
nr:MAG TPA: Baseplate wedge protein [Caudoviricetes sp.]